VSRAKGEGEFTDPEPNRKKRKSMFTLFLRWWFKGSLPVRFPCLHTLIHISAVLPVGSASVERTFSTMKLLKTRLRSTLGSDTLERLMLISQEGPEELSTRQVDAVIDKFRMMKPRDIALKRRRDAQ
jgi:hypothetical protein